MDTIQSKLIRMLDQAYEAELAFVANLSDSQRQAAGTPDSWSPKDTLAHIAAWNAHEAGLLQAMAQGEIPQLSGDINEINAGIYAEHQAWSWEQVMRLLNDASISLSSRLAELTGSELLDPERFAWTRNQPLAQRLAFTIYYHPLDHLARLLWDGGDRQAGARLAETTSLHMAGLDESIHWLGVQRYNLACFYAYCGQQAAALKLVQEAVGLRPDLAEWARQDDDLASLWDNPAFIDLTAA